MIPFCDTPGQSLAVGLFAGLVAAGVGVAVGLGAVGVALLAGAVALVGELLAHAVRGDDQWRAAVTAVVNRRA
ncbi:hypothetical protein [Halorarius halobius]|uniref:hypothetical protein n=1 Tax=Halorarius halobius TaxID=2962671 RepID=UPI0020CEB982|nr:hypothetical protein [Halorarius halobius]